MPAAGSAAPVTRFIRRTQLGSHEYRTNFRQLDCEVIAALVSEEASRVTSQMSKIYLCLVNAPVGLWERDGVLRLTGCEREGKWQTAWEQLVELTGVASATARKALLWMSEQAIIGYYAGKNGVGIRIFINRAASSIGNRHQPGKKILRLVQASSDAPRASGNEVPFSDSFADLKTLEININPLAPEIGAPENNYEFDKDPPEPAPTNQNPSPTPSDERGGNEHAGSGCINSNALVAQLTRELVPHVRSAAAREHERTREWFITHALPKAIRVSQRSAYDVLRAHGVVVTQPRGGNRNSGLEVGRHVPAAARAELLTDDVISLAQSCVALLETKGPSVERTLAEMGVEAGGFLLPEDVPKVRAKAEDLLRDGSSKI
jgi:hypothetical protein